LEEHIASIFRVEKIGLANQQVASWLKLSGLQGVISQKIILFEITVVWG
jgi:hypothetical protein